MVRCAQDAWIRLAEFSPQEEKIFRAELQRLRDAEHARRQQEEEQAAEQEEEEEEEESEVTKKKRKRRPRTGLEMKRLGEDPVVRRKAAEKIQSIQRGNWARREAEELRQERSGKRKKKSPEEKAREERKKHEEMMKRNEAATKIQARQRGKQA